MAGIWVKVEHFLTTAEFQSSTEIYDDVWNPEKDYRIAIDNWDAIHKASEKYAVKYEGFEITDSGYGGFGGYFGMGNSQYNSIIYEERSNKHRQNTKSLSTETSTVYILQGHAVDVFIGNISFKEREGAPVSVDLGDAVSTTDFHWEDDGTSGSSSGTHVEDLGTLEYDSYRWVRVGDSGPLFTDQDDTVNFNKLTTRQKWAVEGGADIYDALEGSDIVILPATAKAAAAAHYDNRNTFSAGNGNNNITGGGLKDYIAGGDHVDILYGRGGADVLQGGGAGDHLWGGTGNDSLYGGNGRDTLFGEDNNDTLSGDGEADDLRGGKGNDWLDAGLDDGGNLLDGGEGNDKLFAWGSNDGAAPDELTGGEGIDEFYVTTTPDAPDWIEKLELNEVAVTVRPSLDPDQFDPDQYFIQSGDDGTVINFFSTAKESATSTFVFGNRILPGDLDIVLKGDSLTVRYEHNPEAHARKLYELLEPHIDAVAGLIIKIGREWAVKKGTTFTADHAFRFVSDFVRKDRALLEAVAGQLKALQDIRGYSTTQLERMSKEMLERFTTIVTNKVIDKLFKLKSDYDNDALEWALLLATPFTLASPGLKTVVGLAPNVDYAMTLAIKLYFADQQAEMVRKMPDFEDGTLEPVTVNGSDGKKTIVHKTSDLNTSLGSNRPEDHVYSTFGVKKLPGNIENATLIKAPAGSGSKQFKAQAEPAMTLNGNALDNELVGSDGVNRMSAGKGDDIVFGRGGADEIAGGTGNDVLDGGTGADVMKGGDGDDTYVVDAEDDGVDESDGSGTDSVIASVSFKLAAGVENLTLRGTATRGEGNKLDNALTGNRGDNELLGLGGDDVLDGGAGRDVLDGGAGADHFVFSTRPGGSNIDTIVRFSVADDTIRLSRDAFAKLPKIPAGDEDGRVALDVSAFWASDSGKAHDADDRILYDRTDGRLLYDLDGTGKAKAVHFADLPAQLGLTAGDFEIFA